MRLLFIWTLSFGVCLSTVFGDPAQCAREIIKSASEFDVGDVLAAGHESKNLFGRRGVKFVVLARGGEDAITHDFGELRYLVRRVNKKTLDKCATESVCVPPGDTMNIYLRPDQGGFKVVDRVKVEQVKVVELPRIDMTLASPELGTGEIVAWDRKAWVVGMVDTEVELLPLLVENGQISLDLKGQVRRLTEGESIYVQRISYRRPGAFRTELTPAGAILQADFSQTDSELIVPFLRKLDTGFERVNYLISQPTVGE